MVRLLPLSPREPLYREIETRFRQGWQHPGKSYHLESIYYIMQEGPVAQQHLAANRAYLQSLICKYGSNVDAMERLLFHGTKRGCHAGDDSNNLNPCNLPNCYFCQIMKCSFSLAHVGSNLMYGKGIYTSSVSSKVDGYVWNDHVRSKKHAMFLSNVEVGRSQPIYTAQNWRTGPDPGFDSVEAVTKSFGGAVEYPETIVYREDAILPSAVIIYTRGHN